MLRITKTFENSDSVTLRLDGKLTTAVLHDLEAQCLVASPDEKKIVVLDFAGLTFIDDDAARWAARANADQIRIVNCSLFIESLLQSTER